MSRGVDFLPSIENLLASSPVIDVPRAAKKPDVSAPLAPPPPPPPPPKKVQFKGELPHPDKYEFKVKPKKIPIPDPDEYMSVPVGEYSKVVARFVENVEQVQARYFEMLTSEVQHIKESLANAILHSLNNNDKITDLDKDYDYWDFLKKLAFCFLGAASVAVGGITIAAATGIGSILAGAGIVTSGVATIISSIYYEVGMHKDTAQVISMIGGAIGLISGGASAYLGNETIQELVAKIAITALGLVANGSRAMQDATMISLQEIKAEKALSDKRLTKLQQEFRMLMGNMRLAWEEYQNNIESCSTIAKRRQQEMQQITAYSGPLSAA